MSNIEPISHFLEYFRFTDGIATSDILGWIFAAFAGFIAYKLIDNMQTNIERHTVLASMENDLSQLFDSTIALKLEAKEDIDKIDDIESKKVFVRSVLHDDTEWEIVHEPEESDNQKFRIVNNQRYIQIRNNDSHNEWISTQALHDLLLKVRRIEKMFKGGIIKRIDLADMYRELVPLGTSGRLLVLKDYYNDYDAECIAYVVMQVIVSCEKYNNEEVIKSFIELGDYNKPDVEGVFRENRRNRPIKDIGLYNKFKKICDSREKMI